MADIRKTGVLDNFSRPAPENPVKPPWYVQPAADPVHISNGALGGNEFPPASCLGYYGLRAFGGSAVETWGSNVGDPALSDAWRMGMFTYGSCPTDKPSGYQVLLSFNVGGIRWTLRRYDQGTFFNIATNFISDHAGLTLMRISNGIVEVWFSSDGGVNWAQRFAEPDATYIGPWYFIYGVTGVETAWGSMGGGSIRRTQIYRYVSN